MSRHRMASRSTSGAEHQFGCVSSSMQTANSTLPPGFMQKHLSSPGCGPDNTCFKRRLCIVFELLWRSTKSDQLTEEHDRRRQRSLLIRELKKICRRYNSNYGSKWHCPSWSAEEGQAVVQWSLRYIRGEVPSLSGTATFPLGNELDVAASSDAEPAVESRSNSQLEDVVQHHSIIARSATQMRISIGRRNAMKMVRWLELPTGEQLDGLRLKALLKSPSISIT